MKRLSQLPLIILLGFAITLSGCVADDDFNPPETSITEPILDGPEVSISAIAGQLAQAQGNSQLDYTNTQVIYTFNEISSPQYLTGFVISSDEAGNFFEEIIIQDRAENPNIGIKVLIDANPLFGRYEPGRKLYIRLNGLSIGITNGVLSLGMRNGNQIDKIAGSLETSIILRSTQVETLVAKPLTIEQFNDSQTNLLIALENVQFNRSLVMGTSPYSYASEPFDEFDGERELESCATPRSVIFSTSTFADFKNLSLPSGRGNIQAILSKNFFGEVFNVVVNSPADVNLNNPERCDPDFLTCDGLFGGSQIIFSENFETFNDFESEGWTNINITNGNTVWTIGSFSSNRYAQISGFNSNEPSIQSWLISPAINLESSSEEALQFIIQTSFYNGNILTLYVSEDYSGNPTDASWQPLDAIIPNGPAGGFGNFETVGPINISCLSGTVYFGFLYEGSDPAATTRYHLDDFIISGN